MSETEKKSFLVHYDNEIIVTRLPDEQAGKLFKSLFTYGRENIKPDFEDSPALAMAFDVLSMVLDRDKEKYISRCQRNRENGRKGGLAKASNSKQTLPNAKQGLANLADKDKDRDKDNNRDIITYQQIADMYNNTCVSFPRITKLSEKRKKAMKARLRTYTLEDFQKLFEMAEASSFLKGQNSRSWSATFDWLITDANMAKVLDGNYADKDSKEGGNENVHGNTEQRDGTESKRPASDFYKQYLLPD